MYAYNALNTYNAILICYSSLLFSISHNADIPVGMYNKPVIMFLIIECEEIKKNLLAHLNITT